MSDNKPKFSSYQYLHQYLLWRAIQSNDTKCQSRKGPSPNLISIINPLRDTFSIPS